ncbi:MAG: SDR family oxidoreductase [Pseudomonadota bacterium]
MGDFANKSAMVVGGSSGIGRAVVRNLAAQGARVLAIARNQGRLDQVASEGGPIETFAADATDPATAMAAFERMNPDLLVISVGAVPTMAPLQKLSWEAFSRVWDTDVRATYEFCKLALLKPMRSGGSVAIVSSGAGTVGGSPLSGGYAGAKRMQFYLADYCQKAADQMDLGLRFVALLPAQIMGDTMVGRAASDGYAKAQGITRQQFLDRFEVPLQPMQVADAVLKIATDPDHAGTRQFILTGKELKAAA